MLFDTCYAPVPAGLRGLFWQRLALPSAGAAGEQDALTMEALDYLQGVYTQLQADASKG